jgi:outer membrane protein TolC
VVSTIAYVGRGGPRFYYNTDPEPPWPSYAQIVVNTKSVAATEEIMPRLRRELGPLCPEARVVPRKLEQGPPVGAPVHLRLKAEDYTALRIKADEIIQKLALQPGIFQAYHDMGELAPSLNLKLDQEKMAEVGLSNAQISQISQLGLAGITATYIREGDRNIPVDLRLPAPLRSSPQALLDLPLINSSGDWIPVSQIAQLEWVGKALRLSHHQRERTVNIYGHTDGTRLASRILKDVLPGFQNLPPGMQLTYGGEQEEVDKSFRELALVFFVTVVGQMLIVAAQFNDARITATILSTIPLSMFGAMSGLLITHQVFGFTAFLGIITLGGVVTNHAIMFFEYTRREQSEGQEAMLSAGRKRIRPILLTVLLSIGGLLPLGWGGGNLWPPMAWSLVFGLIYSLPLALIIVPSVYASLSSLSWASLPKFKRAAPLVLIALSMQLCPLPAGAEETPALTISLNQALETALKSHPRVQEFEARWKESQAQRDEAAAPGRPRLNLRAGSNYFSPSQTLNFGPNQINVAVNQNWNSGVSLEYSLFTFGRLEWSGLAAEQREQMAIYEYRLSRQRAWEEITLVYLDLMERQEKLQVASRSHLVRQQALKDTQAQVKAGVSPKFELLRAQAEEQQALQAVFQARGEQVAARSRLGSLLGLPSTANWTLDNALPKLEPLETKGALERALIGRPDLLAMGRAVEAAVARVGFEDSQNSPNLGLQIDYLRQNPTAFRLGEQFSAGVVLQIPLYDGGLSSAKVSAAQQRVQQLKSQQQQLERDVRVEIETLAAALETSEQQWKAAQLQLSAATEAERVARLRYQNGLGTQLERMDAERQRLAAEEAQLSAQFRLHANWTRWRRATASFTPAELLENRL